MVPYGVKNVIDQNVLKYIEHHCSVLFYLNLIMSEKRFRMRAEAEVLTWIYYRLSMITCTSSDVSAINSTSICFKGRIDFFDLAFSAFYSYGYTHTESISLSFLIMISTKHTCFPQERMREQKLCISLRTFYTAGSFSGQL